MKFVKYFFEFLIVIIFFIFFKLLGVKKSSNISCFLFKNIGPLIRGKNIVKKNILIAFPGVTEDKITSIQKNMWCNYGRTFAEYMHLKFFYDNKNQNIKIININQLDRLKKVERPILFFSGHFANFELLAMHLVKNNFNLHALYRPLNNFFLNPVMEYLRKKYICKNQIPKTIPGVSKYKYGARELMKNIKAKQNIALMVDQKVTQGLISNFFNRKALTISLPAQMALKYVYILQPITIKRVSSINFEITINDEIKINDQDDEASITQKINHKLEKMILDNPDQWIWTHDRWRI